MAALLVEQSGTNLYNNNATELARAQARKARALLANAPAVDLESARLTADAIRAEGDTFLWSEEYGGARRLHLAGESFIAGLPDGFQRDPRLMSIRAANLRLLGEAHHKLHETEKARAVLDRAVAINRAVLQSQPDDPQLRRRLVTSLRYRAIVHRTNERDELARQSIEEARAEALRLRDRDPNDVGAMQLFTVVSEVHAQILADLGRFPESWRIGEEARGAYRAMVERAGNAPGALRSMAQALRTDGTNHYNGGDYAGACRLWRQSHAIFAGLQRRGVLTDSDRDNAMTELGDYVARTCTPPRQARGASL